MFRNAPLFLINPNANIATMVEAKSHGPIERLKPNPDSTLRRGCVGTLVTRGSVREMDPEEIGFCRPHSYSGFGCM